MCDTLCALGTDATLFAKNSDRPPSEVQLVEHHHARRGGAMVATQYLSLADAPAAAVLASRPEWLWGFEHGVNEHRLAVGNERLYTVDDDTAARPALIGMDLVRLALERARTADEGLDVITGLLDAHGQGGIADAVSGEGYFSSFLLADPTSAWILETMGPRWAARPVQRGDAISNRITLGTDWTRASTDVTPDTDLDSWRDPHSDTGHADDRLTATRPAVAAGAGCTDARALAATLRHHGARPWGAPGDDPTAVSPIDTRRVTVCMHLPGYQATTSSMIAELAVDPDAPRRAWVALGSPCASIFVPVSYPDGVPDALARPAAWHRFAALRDRVEADRDALAEVRAVLGPLEQELWEEADAAFGPGRDPAPFLRSSWPRVEAALGRLG